MQSLPLPLTRPALDAESSEPDAGPMAHAPGGPEESVRFGRRLLVIEDNPIDIELLRKELSEAGEDSIEIECCNRMSDGLKQLAHGDVDLLVLDLFLAESDGVESLASVLVAARDIPIVIHTGRRDGDGGLDLIAGNMAADDYLVSGGPGEAALAVSIRVAI